MHNNEIKGKIRSFTKILGTLLPLLFWISLIFSFDSPCVACATLICIGIHELGHVAVIFLLGRSPSRLRGILSGMKIKAICPSYREELLTYLGGPLANFTAALAALPFLKNEYAAILFAVNAATCFSNLLPVEGYDGYGILRCIGECSDSPYRFFRLLGGISLFTTASLTIISLYMMDRLGEGYWIFFVFFVSTLKKLSNLVKNAKNEQ